MELLPFPHFILMPAPSEHPVKPRRGMPIVMGALVLAAFVLPVRVYTYGWRSPSTIIRKLPWVPLAFCYDAAFIALLTALFLLAMRLASRRKAAQTILRWLFLAVCTITLLAALANVLVVDLLGRPLNLQWLYYSDFLRSMDAHAAMLNSLSLKMVLAALL